MKPTTNPIQHIAAEVTRLIPGSSVETTRPRLETGVWWLDAKVEGQWVTVQWSGDTDSFGITARDDVSYGIGADEFEKDPAKALARVLYLLRSKEKTKDPCP